eukprot:scaffold68497_cov44-Phaeocystis_antarctica.AAC.2
MGQAVVCAIVVNTVSLSTHHGVARSGKVVRLLEQLGRLTLSTTTFTMGQAMVGALVVNTVVWPHLLEQLGADETGADHADRDLLGRHGHDDRRRRRHGRAAERERRARHEGGAEERRDEEHCVRGERRRRGNESAPKDVGGARHFRRGLL